MDKILYTPNNDRNSYNLWMAYPACESFALSSLGYLWLSKIADEFSGINSERVYTDTDYTKISAKEVQAIAFSISFDFDYIGVLDFLKKYSIPFLSKDRNNEHPLIFAGGPVITTNPEPYKNFFDFMIIGDGETVFSQVLEILSSNFSREKTLEFLAEIEGVYIPNVTQKVKKITEVLNTVIYTPILSEKSYFKNTFIIEVSRGCMNRCAFCTASYLNLPFRYYEYEKIIQAIELGLTYTNKIALLGAQISAHPKFNDIMKYIKDKMDTGLEIELGISSLRTDSVTPEMVQTLVKGGQRSSTIAIEAASDRLRKLINKNLSEEQILNAVKICRENGLRGLKIYSMIGISTETDEDIKAFINLAQKIKADNKGFEITFSFSTFIPKPQTPMQWEQREESKTLEKKQKFLEKELAKLGIGSKFSSPKWDYWQTVLSRGDDSLTQFLLDVYNNGGKIGAYKSALKSTNIDIDSFVNEIATEKVLPWDFIENYPHKQLLINERKRLSKYINM